MFIYITQRPPVKEIVHHQKQEDVDRREAEEGILFKLIFGGSAH